MTKGELRKLRKQRTANGQSWNIEMDPNGHLEMVQEHTPAQKRRHEQSMYRWAKRYDELNGAPESDCDR